jgi:hypothetical protein
LNVLLPVIAAEKSGTAPFSEGGLSTTVVSWSIGCSFIGGLN